MDRRASGGTEGQAREVAGDEEIFQQGNTGFFAFRSDFLISFDDHLNGFIAEELGIRR